MAALLSLLALVTELQELGFQDNLFRKLVSKGESQNVFAVVPPAGEHHRDLVLMGHIDTQRTPLVFSTPAWVERYKSFTTVAFVLFAVQVLLFSLGTVFQWAWIWPAAIPCAVCALLLAALCIEADRSPYTAGANDNATAVAMVLGLAEEFAAQPLAHTRVWCVCTGCEEVQHYGAIDFFKRHRSEMKDPRGLVFEMLGCAGPGWLTQEGIIVPFHSDAELQKLAQELSAANPDWGAYPVQINGGNTELADCSRFNVPAITFFGLTPTGEAPFWHQPADTSDKIQPLVLQRSYQMIRAMIARIDLG